MRLLRMVSGISMTLLSFIASAQIAPQPLPRPDAVRPDPVPPASLAAPSPDEAADCLFQLKRQKVRFNASGRSERGSCSVDNTVEIEAVDTPFGLVSFPDKPVLACDFAATLTSFVQDIAAPLARARFSAPLSHVATGPGYVCRNRNNQSDTKPSEHAKAAAVDVAMFTLGDGRQIAVHPDDGKNDAATLAFVRGLRRAACGYFTTVLGPGSNAEHGNHFHFDTALHGRTANYRICE
ncbi:MAG: hypothetical protein BVN31_02105 [Proteobacteria bacterium ST_bin15]|nr:MAG: hypothetical protein BVN31_02105 [Proteobacteria bacterium ST_bin15]